MSLYNYSVSPAAWTRRRGTSANASVEFECRGPQLLSFCYRISALLSSMAGSARGADAVSALPVTPQAPHGHGGTAGLWMDSLTKIQLSPTTIVLLAVFIKYTNPRERKGILDGLKHTQKNLTFICWKTQKQTHANLHHHNTLVWVQLRVRFVERKSSPMRLLLRSYLHKQLDNGLVIRLYSVLRYRQRHCW